MPSYSYADCLERSYKVNWKIKDVLGFADFDLDRDWLPAGLSARGGCRCLDAREQRQLTHVEMGAYAHLFGYVEAFIAPQMVALAGKALHGPGAAFEALTNFAAEEVKHIHLFREIRGRVDEKLGFPLALLAGEGETAAQVLGRHPGAILLLTSAIEWLTQHHYLTAMRITFDLDPLTLDIFRSHWLEEAQHARLDHLETLRLFQGLTEAGREEAIEDLLWLISALDALLQEQAGLDLANLATYLGRDFTPAERRDLQGALLGAKRQCFLASGFNHPNFRELLLLVSTPAQQAKVRLALNLLLQDPQAGLMGI
jgi:hypothetical protein